MIAVDNIFVDVNGITKLNSQQKCNDPNNASVLTTFPIAVSAGLASPSSEGAKSKLNWHCQNKFTNVLVGKMKSTCLIYVGTKLRLEHISHFLYKESFASPLFKTGLHISVDAWRTMMCKIIRCLNFMTSVVFSGFSLCEKANVDIVSGQSFWSFC